MRLNEEEKELLEQVKGYSARNTSADTFIFRLLLVVLFVSVVIGIFSSEQSSFNSGITFFIIIVAWIEKMRRNEISQLLLVITSKLVEDEVK